jgi:hypothetical protein
MILKKVKRLREKLENVGFHELSWFVKIVPAWNTKRFFSGSPRWR